MKSFKFNSQGLITLSVLAFVLLNSIYIFCVKGKSAEFGQYGDFIGGTLNPLFSIAIIYLTYTIAKSSDEKANENIEVQKIISISQMRKEAVSELSKVLNEYNDKSNNDSFIDDWKSKASYLMFFHNNQIYLFEELFSNQKHISTANILLDTINQLIKFDYSALKSSLNETEKEDVQLIIGETIYDYSNLFEKYSEIKTEYISNLNKEILKGLSLNK